MQLNSKQEFKVKESLGLNMIVIGTFYLLFGWIVWNFAGRIDDELWRNVTRFSPLIFLPAIVIVLRTKQKQVIITVNKTGIYHERLLVTDWHHFKTAYVTDEMKIGRFKDNFILNIEYQKEDAIYKRKIPLTNTQNKSEEEIVEAIFYFRDMVVPV